MRNLGTVLDSIFAIAPDLEPHFESLIDSLRYCPPENMVMWWREAAYILNSEAQNHPKAEDIAKIFGGTE